MKVRLHPDAVAELENATLHYEQCQRGLGRVFVAAVHAALQGVQVAPQCWPVLEDDLRRHMVKIFPYAILYTQEPKKRAFVTRSEKAIRCGDPFY